MFLNKLLSLAFFIMNKKKQKAIEEALKRLPALERKKIDIQNLDHAFLDEGIEKSKKAMKTDAIFGIPWVIIYGYTLFTFGPHVLTLGVFIIGIVFFAYAIRTRGSYGVNKKRVQVYEKIKEIIK